MKCYISAVCALSVLVALTCAAPMPQSNQDRATDQRETTTRVVNGINSKIMFLRQLCPPCFQVIDNVIQNVTSTAFRVIGRVLLQSGGLGGGGGGGGDSRVSVVLPTFAPDDYEDEEDEEEEDNNVGSSSSSEASSATTTTSSTLTQASSEEDDLIDIRVNDIRVPIDSAPSPASDSSRTKRDLVRTIRAAEDEDQEAAASGGNGPNPSDDLTNVEADDADRDKRYLPFGGSFGAQGQAGGGSGNFLFDIIRLIAGSGATEESDEKENAPGAGGVAEIDVAKGGDGYTEGIPGPITRLFVLANRGLANLVQDLILRLAQTSERIVNFKARLITALI